MTPPRPSLPEQPIPGTPPAGALQSPPGSAGISFKYGLIFGLVAAAPNLLQVLSGVAAVGANQSAIAAYQVDFKKYQSCIMAGGTSATCTAPQANGGIAAIFLATYGTCCLAFVATLVLYLFAGRVAARVARRRGPGIWAAIIAAVAGSLLYTIASLVAVAITGRSALAFGLPAASTPGIVGFTLISDVVGMAVAAGGAALMGWWGASLGAPRPQVGWNAPPVPGAYGPMPPYPPYPPAPGAYAPGYPPYPPAAYPPVPPSPGDNASGASPDAPSPPASPPTETP